MARSTIAHSVLAFVGLTISSFCPAESQEDLVRIVIVEKQWDEKVSESKFSYQNGEINAHLTTSGRLVVKDSDDLNQYVSNLSGALDWAKDQYCQKSFSGPLYFWPNDPEGVSGFGPRALLMQETYTAQEPQGIKVYYFNAGSTWLKMHDVKCSK